MKIFKYIYYFLRGSIRTMQQPRFQVTMFFVVVAIFGGALFYKLAEGMSWLDSFYFTVMTLTTIGYGDLVPVTEAGKLFTTIYSILGIGIMFAFIAVLAKFIQKEGALIREIKNSEKKNKKKRKRKKR